MNFPPPRSPSSWNTLTTWLESSLKSLGIPVSEQQLEAWAIDLYTAMGGPLRRFHTLEHLFKFEPQDAVETLAVLYHDVVYWSVDGSWPPGFASVLSEVCATGAPGGTVATVSELPHYAEILSVFGRKPGDVTGGGTNELFSALAFSSALGQVLGRETTLAVATCIEATIAFRGSPARKVLQDRLIGMGLANTTVNSWLTRAVRMANQDVGDFRLQDAGTFLGGTWNLLPELNPDLRITAVFTIQAYRKALVAMDRFFAFLKPELLFDQFGDEPSNEGLAAWRSQAAANLVIARNYLGAKLLASSLLEAFALETGTDVPLSMFMGAASDLPENRLEALLPALEGDAEIEPVYFLLEWGRSTDSSFDLTNSPLAAWIYRQLSPSERAQLLAASDGLFSGALAPSAFLRAWPPSLVGAMATALARFVPTRRRALAALEI